MEELAVSGKVYKVLNETGTSKAGKDWEKATVVIETEDQYPKKIAVTFMGEKVLPVAKALKEGEKVKLHLNISSQSQDEIKWYSNINGWRVEKLGITPQANVETPVVQDNDDLPF
jgi:hypothetical protein